MRKTYQVLSGAIAALVVVQAGAIAWAFFGLNKAISQDGLVINKTCLESDAGCGGFAGEFGFALHMGYVGSMLIPLLALLLLVVSFFAKVRGGVVLALVVVGLVVLQIVVLPMLSREVSTLFGALHGVNALVLMGVAGTASRKASLDTRAAEARPATTATV